MDTKTQIGICKIGIITFHEGNIVSSFMLLANWMQ